MGVIVDSMVGAAMKYEMHLKIPTQTLYVYDENKQCVRRYLVSTAANGPGEEKDSEKTPTGWHQIRAKIGAAMPVNTIFVGRRPTGEIYQTGMRENQPGRDWILTRILWLSGLELGKNRLGRVDTMQRYIYIHGSPDEVQMGAPGSRGCIRMRNVDLLELFDLIDVGTKILIQK